MSVVLDGTKPLFEDMLAYVGWITDHVDEIHEKYLEGDEYGTLIVEIVDVINDTSPYSLERYDLSARLMIATERYIHDYHPEIATIKGGYPKDLSA